jgi:hypothetical protein
MTAHGHWPRLKDLPCTHFPATDVGDVIFRPVTIPRD